ncbi:MAG: PilZ domain-containing protein [Deltaproteobacteria bacterium]|nr:PilZ domain-containing protein [Deltaproteobacteria bacterium]
MLKNGSIPARGTHISWHGVDLQLRKPLEPGSEVDVVFLKNTIKVGGKVSYCQPDGEEREYNAGIEFDHSQEDLVEILLGHT